MQQVVVHEDVPHLPGEGQRVLRAGCPAAKREVVQQQAGRHRELLFGSLPCRVGVLRSEDVLVPAPLNRVFVSLQSPPIVTIERVGPEFVIPRYPDHTGGTLSKLRQHVQDAPALLGHVTRDEEPVAGVCRPQPVHDVRVPLMCDMEITGSEQVRVFLRTAVVGDHDREVRLRRTGVPGLSRGSPGRGC